MNPDAIRAFARETMLPWFLSQEWAIRARLFMYDQAKRIERQEKVIDDWWNSTAETGVMAEDIETLKRLLSAEEAKK